MFAAPAYQKKALANYFANYSPPYSAAQYNNSQTVRPHSPERFESSLTTMGCRLVDSLISQPSESTTSSLRVEHQVSFMVRYALLNIIQC